MSIVAELGEKFANLTGSEAKELRTLLKDRLGIEAPGGDTPSKQQDIKPEPEVPVITDFNVVYDGTYDLAKKINLIKVFREYMGLALGDAKNMVEGGAKTLKEGVDKKAAEEAKAKLEEAGAKISLVPA
jgi:large subunit ribosomal protein L7/L12